MADASAAPKKRTFRKFEYRGIDLDKILKLSENELYDLFRARCRRHRARVGNKPQYLHLVEKCVKSKEGLEPGMKPNPVKTHLRDAIIVPAMIGAIVAVHNGKTFTGVEIKVFFPLLFILFILFLFSFPFLSFLSFSFTYPSSRI